MPTYSYVCSDCGHGFDIRQSFSDEALTVCPRCQGRLHKHYGSIGVVFKGSGFYHNDAHSKASLAGATDGAATGPAKETAAASPAGGDSTGPAPKPAAGAAPGGSTAASTSSLSTTAS